jgi:putative transposase
MPRFFRPLLLLIARLTDRELAAVIQYLKAENDILRSKLPKVVQVTPQERQRLLKFGRPLGSAIKHLITIVSPRTFARWVNAATTIKRAKSRNPGRPRTPDDLRELVLRLARENDWGYTRILGELRKLSVLTISRSTVVNILKEAGLDPCPKRGEPTWAEFLQAHAATLWQCDFFSHQALTWRGWREFYALVFIHVDSRRVFVTQCSRSPDAAWVAEKAEDFVRHLERVGQGPKDVLLFRDRDGKYRPEFDEALKAAGVEVRRNPVRSPNLNAYVERWIQSARVECLDKFIALGERHLNYLIRQYVEHFLAERPHQSKGNRPLPEADSPEPPVLPFPERIEVKKRLGGVLKHYRRAA